MKAAVLREFGRPLEHTDVAPPVPAPGEALVRVRAVGVCATDVKAWRGLFPDVTLPRVLGHEIAGELVEAIDDLPAGIRVACYIYDTCGQCTACTSGTATLCRSAVRLGLERDGGFAEFVAVPRDQLLPIEPQVPFAHAALAMDSVATTWSALHRPGTPLAGLDLLVVGAGGLGLCAVQIARSAHARVAVVEPDARKRSAAKQLGADWVGAPDDIRALQTWADGGVDIGLELSGTESGFSTAVSAVRPGGTVVCCGYRPGLRFGVDSPRLVLDGLTIVGSRAATVDDARAALSAVARGDVLPHVDSRIELRQATEALTRLDGGRVVGRIVIDL